MKYKESVFIGGPWEGLEGSKYTLDTKPPPTLLMPLHPNSIPLTTDQMVGFLKKLEVGITPENNCVYEFKEINNEGNMVYVFTKYS